MMSSRRSQGVQAIPTSVSSSVRNGVKASSSILWTSRVTLAISPPGGEFSAVDTPTGDVVWRRPLGSYNEMEAKGLKNLGAINLGGRPDILRR